MAVKKVGAAVVGEVCLYGGWHGSGWLARTAAGRLLGTGEPVPGRSMTEAVWQGVEALREATGAAAGKVWVHDVHRGVPVRALVEMARPGYYGGLKWEAGVVYEVSAEALVAAAEKA